MTLNIYLFAFVNYLLIFSLSVCLGRFQSWVLLNAWCCVTRVPIQNFSCSSNRSSIWWRVKLNVLVTTSIMINAKYLKGISSSQHWSIKCVAILQERTFFLIWLWSYNPLAPLDVTACYHIDDKASVRAVKLFHMRCAMTWKVGPTLPYVVFRY